MNLNKTVVGMLIVIAKVGLNSGYMNEQRLQEWNKGVAVRGEVGGM